MDTHKNITAWQAVLVGHVWVNIPVLFIILVPFMLSQTTMPSIISCLVLFTGFIVAWGWWAWMVPKWRRWASARVTNHEQLQTLAVMTGLVWPKGWIFEKTEFKKVDDNDDDD